MSPQPFDALAERLSVAERQSVLQRAEIDAMRRDLSGHRRSRWIADAFAVIGVVVAVSLVRSPDPQAQKAQAAAPMVVKAPFTVVDSDSNPILRIQDLQNDSTGGRGLFLYNKATFGVVTMQVMPGSGTGVLTVSDAGGVIVVKAAVTVKGTGEVLAGPASAPPGPGIPPSFILGAKK